MDPPGCISTLAKPIFVPDSPLPAPEGMGGAFRWGESVLEVGRGMREGGGAAFPGLTDSSGEDGALTRRFLGKGILDEAGEGMMLFLSSTVNPADSYPAFVGRDEPEESSRLHTHGQTGEK